MRSTSGCGLNSTAAGTPRASVSRASAACRAVDVEDVGGGPGGPNAVRVQLAHLRGGPVIVAGEQTDQVARAAEPAGHGVTDPGPGHRHGLSARGAREHDQRHEGHNGDHQADQRGPLRAEAVRARGRGGLEHGREQLAGGGVLLLHHDQWHDLPPS